MDDPLTWLRGVLDEDERIAREAEDDRESQWWWDSPESSAERLIARFGPPAVLADIESKRAVLDEVERTMNYEDHGHALAEMVVRLLAHAYRDRPGYRQEWRP